MCREGKTKAKGYAQNGFRKDVIDKGVVRTLRKLYFEMFAPRENFKFKSLKNVPEIEILGKVDKFAEGSKLFALPINTYLFLSFLSHSF